MLSPPFKNAVIQSLGEDWATYVANKRQGGNNGQKGVRFEDFFATYRLAEELCAGVATPGKSMPFLELQAEAIVDDLVVKWGQDQATYYQCKNVISVSWAAGTNPLQDDFSAQVALCTHLNQPNVRTALVVPTEKLSQSLQCSIPKAIATHTDVLYFPYCDGKVNRLIFESTAVLNSLTQLARVDNPTNDELANVFGALLHGITINNGRGTCDDLLASAQSLSPHLIRLMPDQVSNFKLLDGFDETLAKIGGLVYRLSKGFFHWEAFGTSGVFSQNCLSQEFERFQRRVVENKPVTFDGFEILL